MNTDIKTKNIDELLSLSKEDLKNIFSSLSLTDIEDLISKFKEEVK